MIWKIKLQKKTGAVEPLCLPALPTRKSKMKRKITLKEYGGKERKEIWGERGEKKIKKKIVK